MRSNEIRTPTGAPDPRSGFTIPMRSNEVGVKVETGNGPAGFTIPMRSNEPDVIGTARQAGGVYNSHEE